MLSISVARLSDRRVGSVIFGMKLLLSIKSRYSENFSLVFSCNRSMLKSPTMNLSDLSSDKVFIIGLNSEMNYLRSSFLPLAVCRYYTALFSALDHFQSH